MVRHCYWEKNALAIIIALQIRSGKEGMFYDLEDLVLPAWRDGNRYPRFVNGAPHPKAGELCDDGIGLEYTSARQDPDTKDRIIWIGNRHGGWSKVLLISIPYPAAVEQRMKSISPSFVILEEVTNMMSSEYFRFPAAQLGRRRDIEGPQQLYASCNPEGPSHWVYKSWYVECVNEDTGQRDPDFVVMHLPVVENLDWVGSSYIEGLHKLYRDPIEHERMVKGLWIDRPSGSAIFANYFMPELHMVGDALKGIGWKPFKSFPIVVSYDPGPVNFSIHLMQLVFTMGQYKWFVFDELNFVGQYAPTKRVIGNLLRRMDFWNQTCETQFKFIHIGPEDAFNQVRSDGSYDAMEIEKHGKGRIKLRSVPQARNSVVGRVQMIISKFLDETLLISATCGKTLQMFRNLASKKAEPNKYEPNLGLTPVKGIYLHSFDSLSYAPYYFELHPGALASQAPAVEAQVYSAGQRG